MMRPALGSVDGCPYLAGSKLEPGEPIEDHLRPPEPALALEPHPVFEIRSFP
jgi:hypothetical protein